jgi:hypothetical protein
VVTLAAEIASQVPVIKHFKSNVVPLINSQISQVQYEKDRIATDIV